MPTLILSSRKIAIDQCLGAAALGLGWDVYYLDENTKVPRQDDLAIYVGTEDCLRTAEKYGVELLEPPLDLLARMPREFTLRKIEYRPLLDLQNMRGPTFVKPADPLNKCFDAGSYRSIEEISPRKLLPPHTPVLLSEPVEWLAEYRCFVFEGKVIATSPYLSFGRPNWKPHGKGGEKDVPSDTVLAFCMRLIQKEGEKFPPAFVVDVGLIDGRGWATVEFNPVWCAGLLGVDPVLILPSILRTCRTRTKLSHEDRRWVVRRSKLRIEND